MVRIDDILKSFQKFHPKDDSTLIQRAYIYGSRQHEGQNRKSGEPYMIHPMAVAKIVADMGMCTASICAALLHDTIEDTDTTRSKIAELFGDDVAALVDGLTKLSSVQFSHREERQAESFRKMLLATAEDIRIILIKLADRLHNMSTLEHLSQNAQERIAQETRDIYAPLANRLGISWIKADLDDQAFKYLESNRYYDLIKKIAKTKRSRNSYIERTIRDLDTFFEQAGYKIKISGRIKNLYSIDQKMISKGIDYEKVYDAIAFRIICTSVADCYAVFGLLHSRWVPVPGRIKDYIAIPKPNHYQSLHTTVVGRNGERMEIQIRTKEMHDIAEYGVAAHWSYKLGKSSESTDTYKWLKSVLENNNETSDSREFFDSVKVDLFHDEVFVFTPNGDVKSLMKGATPLDFAYAIHSEVGDHCTTAKVNGIQVPFNTELLNGDRVEIITSKTQRPSSHWLDIVVSSRAKSRIRSYLRSEQRKQSFLVGKNLLEKALRKYGVSYNRVSKSGAFEKIAPDFKLTTADAVISSVGLGKIEKSDVVDRVLPENKRNKPLEKVKESPFEKVLRKVKGQDSGIIIDGVDNLLVRFARCCNPLPGEEVLGYVSQGRGIVVHNRNCSKAAVLDPERQTAVQWSSKAVSTRPVKLQIITNNRTGLLADLSQAFQAKGINISSAHCNTSSDNNDRAVNTFTFNVKDLNQLNNLMKALKQFKGVYEIHRLHN